MVKNPSRDPGTRHSTYSSPNRQPPRGWKRARAVISRRAGMRAGDFIGACWLPSGASLHPSLSGWSVVSVLSVVSTVQSKNLMMALTTRRGSVANASVTAVSRAARNRSATCDGESGETHPSPIYSVPFAHWEADRNGARCLHSAYTARGPSKVNYVTVCFHWCRREESNPRPTDYESVALPTELHRRLCAMQVYVVIL